jgi:hypothetical protein
VDAARDRLHLGRRGERGAAFLIGRMDSGGEHGLRHLRLDQRARFGEERVELCALQREHKTGIGAKLARSQCQRSDIACG